MEKIKYDRMTKKEKKELIIKYKKTDKGREMYKRLIRLFIIGIICLIYSIYLFISNYNNLTWVNYLMIIPLFIAAFVFMISSIYLRRKVLNQFAIKKK